MQKLKLPISDLSPTAGYKNEAYKKAWGYTHFGMDCISKSKKTELYGLGDGVVIAAGLDGLNKKTTGKGSGCGYVLVIRYDGVHNHKKKIRQNLICTYMHMKEIPKVKAGDKVTADTLLGYYGNTGANTTGSHLHMQLDTDVSYPLYCSGLSVLGHALLKAGTRDTTVDPTEVLHLGEGQTVHTTTSKWYNAEDFKMLPSLGEYPKIKKITASRVEVWADTQKKKRIKYVVRGNRYEVIGEKEGFYMLKSGGYVETAHMAD